MLLHVNYSTNPAFNLALEEYALTQMNQEITLLWRNEASIIIGRHQNAIEEIDLDFVKMHDIEVIRRLSGGGAVFHDLGNINYTIISALGEDDFGNYKKFALPVCEFLQALGIDASLQGRNDLVINGMKFSGNAQAVQKSRIMHHGTILFDADISKLTGALRPNAAKVESKGIKSIRSRVTNVAEHLPQTMTAEQFFDKLVDFFRLRSDGIHELAEPDIIAVQQLVEEKYGTWEWNIGRSPTYSYRKVERLPGGTVDIRLEVKEGVIQEAFIFGDFFAVLEIADIQKRLTGVSHRQETIRAAIKDLDLANYIQGITTEQFLSLF